MRGLLRRTPTCALHVHVGMPDPETAIRAFNRMRQHLPVLQALAAHSPYWHGIDSGFQTARAQMFRGYPRADIPRTFAGWDDYVETMDALVAAADVEDYTFFWWDLRPHPKLGTLEVRAMDAQARLGSVCGLAALVHGLVLAAVREPDADELLPREVLVESSYRAGRDGLAATVWHDGALRPVRERIAAALELARRHTPAEPALEEIERILRDGNGADRMRAAHAEGGMPRVLHRLIEESAEALGVLGTRRMTSAPTATAAVDVASTIAIAPPTGTSVVTTNEMPLLSACSAMHGSSEPVRQYRRQSRTPSTTSTPSVSTGEPVACTPPKIRPVTSAPPATPIFSRSTPNMKPRKKNSSHSGATNASSTA